MLKKQQLFQALSQAALIINEGWEPDWEDTCQFKYFVSGASETCDYTIDSDFAKSNPCLVYFKSEEAARKAYEMLPDDLKELFKI